MSKSSTIYFKLKLLFEDKKLIDNYSQEDLISMFLFISDYPRLSCSLANKFFPGERVVLWEKEILKNPDLSLDYCKFNIKGPFPEAEELIFKFPRYAVDYALLRPNTFPDYAIKNLITAFMPSDFLDYLETGNLKTRLSPDLEVLLLKGEHNSWHKKAYLTFLKKLNY